MNEQVNVNEMNFSLALNGAELNVIVSALRELPHRVVDDLVRKILDQANSQVQSAQQPKAE